MEKPGILKSSGGSNGLTNTMYNGEVLHTCTWQQSTRPKIDDELCSHNITSETCVLDIQVKRNAELSTDDHLW